MLRNQLRRAGAVRDLLDGEGFARVVVVRGDEAGADVRLVPEQLRSAVALAARRSSDHDASTSMRFGLQISSFPATKDPSSLRKVLQVIVTEAEAAGFDSIWVMDHLRQIPQVGRDWDPMLEGWTTLAWIAALTERVRIGTLVTAVTLRPIGVLAKMLATLDVLSAGRAVCGLGLGWYAREQEAYGIALPPVSERYAVLEDALEVLPLFWGPGSPSFEGRTLHVPEAICYPRPLQERVPILIGGGGERRTLRLAARHADAVNVMGPVDVVRHKVHVLRGHCAEARRDPDQIEVTHFAPTLVGDDRSSLDALVERLRPRRLDATRYRAQANAGTIDDQVARTYELADAGVAHLIVSLPDLGLDLDDPAAAVRRFGRVIDATR